ncbi:MAG TPA: hypothetical protein VIP28_15405 [Nocardioides sp.]
MKTKHALAASLPPAEVVRVLCDLAKDMCLNPHERAAVRRALDDLRLHATEVRALREQITQLEAERDEARRLGPLAS